MSANFYSMTNDEKQIIRQAICDRAYKEIPNEDIVAIHISSGIPRFIINSIDNDLNGDRKILIQGEHCSIGSRRELKEDDRTINMHHVNSDGNPIAVDPLGAKFSSFSDMISFIASKRISVQFTEAVQVAPNGDIAQILSHDKTKTNSGYKMAFNNGCKKTVVCCIEEDPKGAKRLVKSCTFPITGKKCVDLIITDKGVYKPDGTRFKVVERYNPKTNSYDIYNG